MMNIEALKLVLLEDFKRYLRWSFKTKTGTKFIFTKDHHKVCNALMRVYLGEIQNLIINMPPRSGKTEILNAFTEWTITKHPRAKYILTSYSDTLVSNSSQQIRDMLNSQEHKEMFGIETKKDTQSKKLWKTSQGGGVYAVSSFGQITGHGAGLKSDEWGGFIGIDDPLKPNDGNSLLQLDKIIEWYQCTLSNRKNSPKTPIIIIMQRIHTNDLVGAILSNKFKDREKWEVITVKALDEETQTSFWEDFYPLETLLTIKKADSHYFYSQMQQEPIIKGGNLLKADWIKYVKREVVEGIQFEKRFITADTALKEKEINDYTVYSCFGIYQNKLYYLDMFRGKPRSKEREVSAKSFYNSNYKYPFRGMFIEQKASGIDLFQRMKDDGFMVYEIERNTDKVYRAEDISPYLETYGLYVVDDLPNINDFLAEFSQFPNSVHDDIVDTVIDACDIAYKDKTIDYASLL